MKRLKFKNIIYILIMILVAIVSLIIYKEKFYNSKTNYIANLNNEESIKNICQFATLRCYYHNVGENESTPSKVFKYGLFQYGYKKIFIEYSGYVDFGIDASKVKIVESENECDVDITLPDAEILSLPQIDENSIKKVEDVGVLTNASSIDYDKIITAAQNEMRNKALNDKSMFTLAKNNAKESIKNYVKNINPNANINWK